MINHNQASLVIGGQRISLGQRLVDFEKLGLPDRSRMTSADTVNIVLQDHADWEEPYIVQLGFRGGSLCEFVLFNVDAANDDGANPSLAADAHARNIARVEGLFRARHPVSTAWGIADAAVDPKLGLPLIVLRRTTCP